MTRTYGGIGPTCFHRFTVPDWAPADCGCPICGANPLARLHPWLNRTFWIFHRYDETGGPFPELPRHPRGIDAAIKANELKDAGWLETKDLFVSTGDHVWCRMGEDHAYTLYEAYQAAFGKVIP